MENLVSVVVGAYVGGMILNLMPCVFPVLCLKILSFVSMGKSDRKKAFVHSGAYAAGILVSFWILGGILIVFRAYGAQMGWGFQLQSPLFLILLSGIFTLMSLNLFGVFEISGPWTDWGQSWAGQEGWVGAFFSGVLATLVATPCTAPFMGTAIGFALTQPALISLFIFSCLGMGLATPYVLISAFPILSRWLPRPGQWMVTLKQGMGFLLLLTTLWLISVLSLQLKNEAVMYLLAAHIGLSFGIWLTQVPSKKSSWAYKLAGVLVLGFCSYFAFLQADQLKPRTESTVTSDWKAFSERDLASALEAHQPVFIDFTAAWCITCQVNERVALEVTSVQEAFKAKGIKLFKADWTEPNEAIAKRLESYGRQGIPVYALYDGRSNTPTFLPQILTPQIVLSALDKLPLANSNTGK